jgi:hypothetical protein
MAERKKKPGGQPKLNDERKAQFMVDKAMGMSNQDLAAKYEISTVTVWSNLKSLEGEIAKMAPYVQQVIKNIEVLVGSKIAMVLDGITQGKVDDANLAALATTLTQLNTVRRLESGQATSTSEVKYSRINIDDYKNPTKIVEVQEVQAVSSTEQTPIACDNAQVSDVPAGQEKEP